MQPRRDVFSHFPLQWKRFVKASASSTHEDNVEKKNRGEMKGEDVMNFYNEIIQADGVDAQTVKQEAKVKVKEENEVIKAIDTKPKQFFNSSLEEDDDVRVIDPAMDTKLLTAAQSGDKDSIIQLLQDGAKLNVMDKYGWSALMISSAAGHSNIVEYLLSSGADTTIKDKSGRNAMDIANIKGNFDVLKKFQSWQNKNEFRIRKKKSEVDEFETCDVCGEIYQTINKNLHIASMPHQLKIDRSELEIDPGFSISQTNKGYQLLRKGGWDGRSGLGVLKEGRKTGRLFPIKSVLKRDREGVQEGTKKSAKITHFAANDKESILNAQTRVQKKNRSNPQDTSTDLLIRKSLGIF